MQAWLTGTLHRVYTKEPLLWHLPSLGALQVPLPLCLLQVEQQ